MELVIGNDFLTTGRRLNNFGAVVYYAPTLESAISVGNVRGFKDTIFLGSADSIKELVVECSKTHGLKVPKIVTAIRSEESDMLILTNGKTFTLLQTSELVERKKGTTPVIYWEMDDINGIGIFAYRGGDYWDNMNNYGVNLPNLKDALEWLFDEHENITYEKAYDSICTLESEIVVSFINGEYYVTWLDI